MVQARFDSLHSHKCELRGEFMPTLLVREHRSGIPRAEYIDVTNEELNQFKINPEYGGFVYTATEDMFAIFKVMMIDDFVLTGKTVDELKELFKTEYGVELEEF